MKLDRLQKYSKGIVNLCIRSFLVFTAIVLIYNWFGKQVQVQMIYSFSAFIGIELVTLMWGTVTKEKYNFKDKEKVLDHMIAREQNDYDGRGS